LELREQADMKTHIPVMTKEVLEIFGVRAGAVSSALFVDATLGAGGHASEILEKFPDCRLIGFDQDEQARAIASEKLSRYGGRVRIIPGNFRGMSALAEEKGWPGADGILFDLGVSNMQLVTPERGFSFQDDGPLDMRMDRSGDFPPASRFLAELGVGDLARIFREYGEERYAYQIAKAIVRARERGTKIETTGDLTELIRGTLPSPVQRKMGTHPARRVFQALRIAVNSELDVLDEALEAAISIAGDGCAIIVISYHSLEDRMIKRRFIKWVQEEAGRVIAKRPVTPGEDEIESNRSSRSAKLRGFVKGTPIIEDRGFYRQKEAGKK
jgi:16S rRNA (cytosine1402-N4)-methyltransferase